MVRASNKALPGLPVEGTGVIAARIEAALPFSLTSSQVDALVDIRADIAGPGPAGREGRCLLAPP